MKSRTNTLNVLKKMILIIMLLLTSITLASCNGDKTEKFIVKFENTEYKDKKIEKGSILEKPETHLKKVMNLLEGSLMKLTQRDLILK
ncbi:MAG: hypothetical protein GX312_02045 [Candidatus Phytoplasma sp.]|nr:hypothetical protein [Phytoplasma sp.]